MSKSRHNKNLVKEDYEEDNRPRQKHPKPDKHIERRIQRALKTKNVYDYLKYDETCVEDEGADL